MAEPFDFDGYLKQTESASSGSPSAQGFDFDSYLKATDAEAYDNPLLAGAAGLARGASFGLSDVALRGLGVEKETLAKLKEYNPTSSLVGEIGGVIAPTLLSGGAGLLGTAARGAAAPVSAVTRAGAAVEGALARQFINSAAKSTARKVLESAAARGVGSAVEGLAYGAGQVISEAALGDPKQVAENALATMGVSALLGGAFGAGTKIAGAVVKGSVDSMKPYVKNLRQNLVGISDDSAKVILNKPEAVQELSKYGDDVDEIFKNVAAEKAAEASTARYSLIDSVKTEVRDLIEKNGLSGKTTPVDSLFKAIDDAKKKISPKGAAVTSEVRGNLQKLQSIEDDLLSYSRASVGLGNEVPLSDVRRLIDEQKIKLNALDLNDLKSQYYASTKDAFLVGKSDPANTLYERLASLSNKALDDIDPAIRKANSRLSQTLEAQEKLKLLGMFDRYEFDPEKFKKVFSANGSKWVEYKDALKVLDDNWGTNLVETAELGRAYKELYPKDMISRSFTGRSLLAPTLGGAAGGLLGGPVGAAAGVLTSAAMASPAATRLKLQAYNTVEDVLKKSVLPGFNKFSSSANKFVPDNLAPYISAKVAALTTLERQNQKVDRQVNGAINGFFSPDTFEQNPTSFNQLKGTSFDRPYARSIDDRVEAFNKRLNEIMSISQDLESLNNRVAKNTYAINMVAPTVAQELSAKAIQAAEFLMDKAPKNPIMDPLQPAKTDWRPSDAQLAKFERYVEAVENPLQVLNDLKSGIVTREQVEALQYLYPSIYDKLAIGLREKAATSKKSLSYKQRNTLSILFQQPMTQLHKPEVMAMLQGTMNSEGQNQPTNSSGPKKMSLANLTETQRIESGEN